VRKVRSDAIHLIINYIPLPLKWKVNDIILVGLIDQCLTAAYSLITLPLPILKCYKNTLYKQNRIKYLIYM